MKRTSTTHSKWHAAGLLPTDLQQKDSRSWGLIVSEFCKTQNELPVESWLRVPYLHCSWEALKSHLGFFTWRYMTHWVRCWKTSYSEVRSTRTKPALLQHFSYLRMLRFQFILHLFLLASNERWRNGSVQCHLENCPAQLSQGLLQCLCWLLSTTSKC